LVFVSLPVPAYQQLMEEVFGTQWKNIFLYVRDGTFNILSLLMVLSISYSYSAGSDERYGHNVSPIITALVALSSFVAISGINKELVGRVASEIRSLKKPEPYKGKGIKYTGEHIRRKAGKAAGAK